MNLRKPIFIFLGLFVFGLGTVGVFLPILPTVPLYLLALVLFANSSERLHNWYIQTKLYKRFLLPYQKAGGLTKKAKARLIILVTLQILIATLLVRDHLIGIIVCLAIYTGFLLSMFFAVKTVTLDDRDEKNNKR